MAGPADQDGPAAGLVRAAGADRDLRDDTRARTRLAQDRARCWPRLEKRPDGALVTLSAVASKLTTISAQDMIRAMAAGPRGPCVLAGLARGRGKATDEDLAEALDGLFDDHHGELAGLLLDHIAVPGERYSPIARRRGKAKAQIAVARSLLVVIWHPLANPATQYTDLGYGYYQARPDTDRKLRNHIRQIQAPGFDITITKAA